MYHPQRAKLKAIEKASLKIENFLNKVVRNETGATQVSRKYYHKALILASKMDQQYKEIINVPLV